MPAQPILLILGGDPRANSTIARKFARIGYLIIFAVRSLASSHGYTSIDFDVNDPSSVPSIFHAIRTTFGWPPNAVVYIGTLTETTQPSVPIGGDMRASTVSAYVAAHEAAKGFGDLPLHMKKAFVYVGSINTQRLPVLTLLTLGVRMASCAHWIEEADVMYASKGYRCGTGSTKCEPTQSQVLTERVSRFLHVDQCNIDGTMSRSNYVEDHANLLVRLIGG